MGSFLSRLRERLRRKRFYGLRELDRKLLPWLDFRGGFFVEAGANDGLAYSNTLHFERFYDWRGLLIEPIPELAARCRINRPRCLVENCALVPFSFQGEDIPMSYCDLMSMVDGAMGTAEADAAHLRLGREVQGIDSHSLRAPARTLTAILDQHRITSVDFLSLDVEGYELPALQGLDFDRIRLPLMLVESRNRAAIDSFLAQRGYQPIAELSHHDVLYRRNY